MQGSKFFKSIDRRTFMQVTSFTGLSGLLFPKHLLSNLLNTSTSRVIVVEDDVATNGNTINSETVQFMMDSGIKSLAQQSSVGDAWKQLLPGIDPTKTIAIKVNCINSSVPTHPEVVNSIVSGLVQMQFENISFPENNIIIFDRTTNELRNSGYTINTSDIGVRCFGTNSSGVGTTSQSYDVSGSSQRLSKILTDMTDYLINVSVMKNHGMAGVTFCMKNHYGSCHNPGGLHSNNCDPYIAALNALDPIVSRQKVNICDSLYGIKSGGPGGAPQMILNKLLMSADVVSLDYQGRKILEDNGCYTLAKSHHIETAGSSSYNLGVVDPQQMDVVNITNPSTHVDIGKPKPQIPMDYSLQQNFPNPFNSQTNVQFYLPKSEHAKLIVYNSTGQRVNTLINRFTKSGWNQITWNGKSESGREVASGIYVCQLQVGDCKKAIMMQYVR